MARQSGMVKEDGSFEGEKAAFCVDALAACISGLLGMSPCVVFIESTVAIEVGARTGLAAVASACGFLLSIVFNPILSSIPPYATGAALVLVGCILMEHLGHIDWRNKRTALSAFMTVALMPYTYSIAYGVMGGIGTAIALRLIFEALDAIGAAWKRMRRRTKGCGADEEGGDWGGVLMGHGGFAEQPPPEGLEG